MSFPTRAALALAALLGACAGAGSTITDSIPHWAGGEPANVSPRPAVPPAYPAVNASIPAREAKPLTAEEQQKEVADLVAARNRAQAEAKAARANEDIASGEGLALARGKYAGDSPPRSN